MYTQLIRYLERRPEKYTAAGADNVQTLLLMDEFARFGKLEMITAALSTLRSKNVNICLMIQSVAQLDNIYGKCGRRIIFDNCQYQAILRANDTETQKYLSELIGVCIRRRHSAGENFNDAMNTTGYSMQISEVREWRVFPNEFSTLKDILLLTPYGFCRVDKLRPGSDLTIQLLFDLAALHSHDGELASLDEPMYLPPDITIENEGAVILSIEDRSTNAANRLTAFQHQKHVERRQEREAKEKKDNLCRYIVGEMVIQYFPELKALEPRTREENEKIFAPLKAFLIELVSDRELLEQLKARSKNRDLKNGVYNPPGPNV